MLIEIKSADNVDERDTRVLEGFVGDFKLPLALCVSRDATRMQIGKVLCLHWRDAFGELNLA